MAAGPRVDVVVTLANENDIVIARQLSRTFARDLGFGLVDQSRIATAVSELTRNVIRYATNARGIVRIRQLAPARRGIGIEIVVSDEGPGIEDVGLVLQEGYSTGRGMGMGLPGTRRLMDEMEIDTALGRGTNIVIRKWRR